MECFCWSRWAHRLNNIIGQHLILISAPLKAFHISKRPQASFLILLLSSHHEQYPSAQRQRLPHAPAEHVPQRPLAAIPQCRALHPSPAPAAHRQIQHSQKTLLLAGRSMPFSLLFRSDVTPRWLCANICCVRVFCLEAERDAYGAAAIDGTEYQTPERAKVCLYFLFFFNLTLNLFININLFHFVSLVYCSTESSSSRNATSSSSGTSPNSTPPSSPRTRTTPRARPALFHARCSPSAHRPPSSRTSSRRCTRSRTRTLPARATPSQRACTRATQGLPRASARWRRPSVAKRRRIVCRRDRRGPAVRRARLAAVMAAAPR